MGDDRQLGPSSRTQTSRRRILGRFSARATAIVGLGTSLIIGILVVIYVVDPALAISTDPLALYRVAATGSANNGRDVVAIGALWALAALGFVLAVAFRQRREATGALLPPLAFVAGAVMASSFVPWLLLFLTLGISASDAALAAPSVPLLPVAAMVQVVGLMLVAGAIATVLVRQWHRERAHLAQLTAMRDGLPNHAETSFREG